MLMMTWLAWAMCGTALADGEKDGKSDGPSMFALPVAYYTSDTGFGGGGAFMKSYHPERVRVSNAQLFAVYTVKDQFSLAGKLDHFFPGGRDRLKLDVSYVKFPTAFYGIGNYSSHDTFEDYTPLGLELETEYERRIGGDVRVTGKLSLDKMRLEKYEPGGEIETTVPWGRGRTDVSLGMALLRDSRDNLFATNEGSLAKIEFGGSAWQNRGDPFNYVTLDVRTFVSLWNGVVFASNAYAADIRGDVPFYRLFKLGGQDRLRGYDYERFRDRSLMLFQQDVRYTIWGPIGGAVFASTGRVADDITGLLDGRWHTALGAGIRFFFNRDENMMVRADFARGSETSRYYITFGEAF